MNRSNNRGARRRYRARIVLVLSLLILIFYVLVMPVGNTECDNQCNSPQKGIDRYPDKVVDTYQGNGGSVVQPNERLPQKLYTEADVIALAKMAWGEALVTRSDTEMAATMWCALNRFDSGDPYYRECKTIEAIIKQDGAFEGYVENNPEIEHLVWLALDVLQRWTAEKYGVTDVGRVLPAGYLFFHGDGEHNHFRTEYQHNGQYWDWSLESPYKT